jgi:fumarate hydratase, class I
MSEVAYHELLPLGADEAPYRKLTGDYISVGAFEGQRVVKIEPTALTFLAHEAFVDCQHLLRPGHLAQLRAILDDPEASSNDKFVAFDLLKNANIAAGKVLPMCQDTGTAIVMGKKGQQVWTGSDDAAALSAGIRRTYTETNLRYSQVAP